MPRSMNDHPAFKSIGRVRSDIPPFSSVFVFLALGATVAERGECEEGTERSFCSKREVP